MEHLLRAEVDLAADEARRIKSLANKHIGRPIDLPSKPIQLVIRGNDAWTAESGGIARRTDLITGKTSQIYRGHTAPVTSLAFYEIEVSPGAFETLLITGSWDKTIRVWNTKTKKLISETLAHKDFVKRLLIIQESKLLISSSSDKTVKLWDLAPLALDTQAALNQLGSISAHTRPVEALAYIRSSSNNGNTLLTGDTMGVLKAWSLEERTFPATNSSELPNIRCTLKNDNLQGHRTGIADLSISGEYLWSTSVDSTVQLQKHAQTSTIPTTQVIQHTHAVRCILVLSETPIRQPYLLTGSGEVLRLYDISELLPDNDEVEAAVYKVTGKEHLIFEVDVHSHQVTGLGLWMEPLETSSDLEPCIVSSSLDGTIRRWPLKELLQGRLPTTELRNETESSVKDPGPELTEEEERELAELMED